MSVLNQTGVLVITSHGSKFWFFPCLFSFSVIVHFFVLLASRVRYMAAPSTRSSTQLERLLVWLGGDGPLWFRAIAGLGGTTRFFTLGLSIWGGARSSRGVESPSNVSIGKKWTTPSRTKLGTMEKFAPWPHDWPLLRRAGDRCATGQDDEGGNGGPATCASPPGKIGLRCLCCVFWSPMGA